MARMRVLRMEKLAGDFDRIPIARFVRGASYDSKPYKTNTEISQMETDAHNYRANALRKIR